LFDYPSPPSNMLTYLLTPCSRVHLEKLTGSATSQEIPRIFGTRRFITVLTSARHLSLSWANSIQSPIPPPTSWTSILILSSHLRLGLPIGLFPSGFHTRTLCTPLLSPIRATYPTHHILLVFTTRTIFGMEYTSLSSSLCNLLHSPVTSSLLGPNTLPNTLFSNTLNLRSSLNVSDQVSHPHRTTGNIIVLYILIFNFLDSKLEDKTATVSSFIANLKYFTKSNKKLQRHVKGASLAHTWWKLPPSVKRHKTIHLH